MARLNGRSYFRAVTFMVAVALWAPQVTAQSNPIRTLGSFPWDTSSADVLLQRVSRDRLIVQVRILTESNTARVSGSTPDAIGTDGGHGSRGSSRRRSCA